MPWPEPLAALLSSPPESRAAQALRWGLAGLRASLQSALEDVRQEPGGDQLQALLGELEPLLAGGAVPASVLPTDGAPPAEPARQPRLLPLARAVIDDGRFQAELRRAPLREHDDEAIWGDVQRLLLRVPTYLAAEWRQRSRQFVEQAGARQDDASAVTLPLAKDETIYPGLAGAVQTAGLRSSGAALLDERVAAPDTDDLRMLAGLTSACLWFAENDPAACHCLRSVFRFGIRPLTGDQRERYVGELLRLWARVRATAPGGPNGRADARFKEHVKALLDLDEALHSLVYQPPATPDSWWGRLRAQAREVVLRVREQAAATGCTVHLQLLEGTFADINRLAPDSLQVDFGVPGEVSACLRLWARIDGEELKGRVLYRSPQEET
jgi:hypothetical protein